MKRPNGSGTVFYLARRNCYQAVVQAYAPERRQLSRCFKRKKDALAALPAMQEELLHGSQKKKKAATIGSLYSDWSSSSALKLSDSKQSAYRTAFKRLAPIEHAPVSELVISDLQQLVDGLSYYQGRDIKNLLSHLYQRAMAEQYCTVNLASFIELPTLEEQEAVPFSPEEVRTIWSEFNDQHDIICAEILLMIYSGMMPGELLDAKKDMIDFDNHRITGAGKKTKERKDRNILFPDVIVPVLHAIVDSHPHASLVGMNKWKWYDLYHATLTRIGVRDLPPYSCRHTTATALALGDSNPLLITRIMRHARPLTTERYKHADEATLLTELNKLS